MEIGNFSLKEVKQDLLVGIRECNKRGLIKTAKWLTELNFGLPKTSIPEFSFANATSSLVDKDLSEEDHDDYLIAKSYFDNREYDRAAHFTRNCSSPIPRFLHLYSMYMSKEKKLVDNMPDSNSLNGTNNLKDLSELLTILKEEYEQKKDGYMLYLYGVVLKKLDLTAMAIKMFLESVNLVPTMWGSWLELAPLITDYDKLLSLSLPNHWMKHFFIGHTNIEMYLNEAGIRIFTELQQAGFQKCLYITAQIAIAYHNMRNVDKAIEIFQEIQNADPYRLDNLDIYSNLLFVKELKTEMAYLAHKAVEIDKYRPETCCVIANYYSIRGDHQKAVVYFQRALKLNPKYLSAWTLMGHEFMEMKNTNAAIQSYRQAIEVNRRDFRAWYGLGQAYEIIKMYCYSLYYYKTAQQLKPYDSRMLVALGDIYEKLEKHSNALKCYQKACNVGDIECIAYFKMAQIYENLEQRDNAVQAYANYVSEAKPDEKSNIAHAFKYLSEFHLEKQNFDEANMFAHKMLEIDEGEAKALFKNIECERNKAKKTTTVENIVNLDTADMSMEDNSKDSMPGMDLITIDTSDIELDMN